MSANLAPTVTEHSSTSSTAPNRNPKQQGIFVFEADTAAFASRKRAARACAVCSKRKKRCPHTFSKADQGTTPPANGDSLSGRNGSTVPAVRFVGDMHAEGILTDLTAREKGVPRISQVGTWVEQNRRPSPEGPEKRTAAEMQNAGAVIVDPEETRASLSRPSARGRADAMASASDRGARFGLKRVAVEKYNKIERSRRTLTGHQKSYLQAVGAFRVLPKATEDALVTTYIACVNPLLPILDGKTLLEEYTSGEASPFLIQAVCLVACKTEEAKGVLRLYEDGPLLDTIPFARTLHTGLDAAIKADLEADRFTKVQIMALMSLHNDGPGGIEESSSHLIQAIHDAQTLGIHINTLGRTRNDQRSLLWWTLWLLDKFNACLGGRPLMIAERDIDIQEPQLDATDRGQAMMLWMRIGRLLDKVIEYYRPSVKADVSGWEHDFPTFEDILSEHPTDMLLRSQLAGIELAYHIVGILTCRAGGPSTLSYNRRIHCASRIQAIVSQAQDTGGLPPIPLVPYATSLSLTVAYRGLRDQSNDTAEALKNLRVRCEMLEALQSRWWTADAIAKLGRKAIQNFQGSRGQGARGGANDQPDQDTLSTDINFEVAICKHLPVDKAQDAENQRRMRAPDMDSTDQPVDGNTQEDDRDHGQKGDGTALHVLSDAAWSKRTRNTLPEAPVHRVHKTRSSTHRNSNDRDLDKKRRRMDERHHSYQSGSVGSPAYSLASKDTPRYMSTFRPGTSTPSSLTSSTAQTPGPTTLLAPAANLYSSMPAVQLDTSPEFPYVPDDLIAAAALGDSSAVDTCNGPSQNSFDDLDNLFDGFFDLSMPTMFNDPLFDTQWTMDDSMLYSGMPDLTGNSTSIGTGTSNPVHEYGPVPDVDMDMDMHDPISTSTGIVADVTPIARPAGSVHPSGSTSTGARANARAGMRSPWNTDLGRNEY